MKKEVSVFIIASFAAFVTCLEDMTMVGARNQAISQKDMDDTTIIGSHLQALNSTESLVIGHNTSISNSKRVVAIGNEIKIHDKENIMAIGRDLSLSGIKHKHTKIVFGSYNAPSNASFVFANGNSNQPSNILEIFEDGSIHSQQIHELIQSITILRERVNQLETRLSQSQEENSNQNGECSCAKIHRFYMRSGCCSK